MSDYSAALRAAVTAECEAISPWSVRDAAFAEIAAALYDIPVEHTRDGRALQNAAHAIADEIRQALAGGRKIDPAEIARRHTANRRRRSK